jgi:myo-inositol-1(or 4)-monophosphatase
MDKIKQISLIASKQAGAILLKQFNNFDRAKVQFKTAHEIVTKADLASERIIISAIKKNFPEHSILSEEAGMEEKQSDYMWIIDPLDGTTNFSMHNPLWSVAFALAYQKEIIFSIVYIPVLGEIFMAEKGKGAYMIRNNKKIKLKVSDFKEGKVLNAYCHGKEEKDMRRAIKYYSYQKLHGFDCRQLGSASIEMAFVAAGRIESIAIPGVSTHDAAPGALLVAEANGRVTDYQGKKWITGDYDILASNGLVHEDVLKVLNQ